MESFIHNGKVVKFWPVSGIVLSSEKHSETHVKISSSGGGGTVGPSGGYVSPPQISSESKSVTHHEIWIQSEDGTEIPIKIVKRDIPLRQGQHVTFIIAGIDGVSSYPVVLINHSAGNYSIIEDAEAIDRKFDLENYITTLDKVIAGFLFISFILIKAHFFERNESPLGTLGPLLSPFIYLGYRAYVVLKKHAALQKRLNEHLNNIAKIASNTKK